MKCINLLFCFFVTILSAQSDKGLTPIPSANSQTGTTRAVVIGISDYQDPEIPDLKYADRDAEAFANFLRSSAGGSLHADQLKLLTNQQATTAQVASALDWLIDASKEGEQVIIYFSGHGDVETKTRSQQGFLLCWDSPPRTYVAGAYPIFFLQEVVSTLSIEKKVKVLLITDACRAGKLAGNAIGGAQLTSANLSRQFGNEIKILSCQPNEYSVEGIQWGGGRGAFSYHLVDGLYGMADNNGDQAVNLFEIGRYLEDHVTSEVAPQSQLPMTIGNRTEKLFSVNQDLLAQIRKNKSGGLTAFSPTDSRGMEDEVLANADTSTRTLYLLFKKAIQEKAFFEPLNACADAYYERLIREPGMAALYATMKRNYAAALQDDAQQVVNIWLKADVRQLECIGKSLRLDPIPHYLGRAAELLGTQHYFYKTLKSRQYLFEGYLLGHASWYNFNESLGRKCLALYQKSLELEPNSAVTYYQMSHIYAGNLRQVDSALLMVNEAHRLAPTWILPFTDMAEFLTERTKQRNLAWEMIQEAAKIDSTHGYVYGGIAYYYLYQNQPEKALYYLSKYEANGPLYPCWYASVGHVYSMHKNYPEAEKWYKKGIEMDPSDASLFNFLGDSYMRDKRYTESEQTLLKAISLDSMYYFSWVDIGILYHITKRFDLAETLLLKAISLDATQPRAWDALGNLYMDTHQSEKAIDMLNKAIAADSNYINPWITLSTLYINKRLYPEAEKYTNYALSIDSTNQTALINLGSIYTSTNRYPEAEKIITKTLSIDSTDLTTWSNLGTLKSLTGQYEESQSAYLHALSIDSTCTNALVGLGFIFTKMKRYPEAEKKLLKAIDLDASDISAWNNLGWDEWLLKKYPEAEKALRKAISLDSTFANPVKHLAMVKFETGHPQEAREGFQKAIALNPDYAAAYVGMAYVYAAEGHISEAIEYIAKGIEKGSTFDFLQDDPNLASLRALPQWKDLIKKYFPDHKE